MKPISNARIIIIAIVTLISVYYTWPTVRYYMHLSSAPEMVGRRVFSETRPPDPADVEAYAAWAEANPAAAQWIENNQAYLEWERENERLQERAIPLGLDLRGGVDITLGLNFNQIRINRTEDLKNELRNLFQVRNVSAAIVDTRPTEITVRADAADARTVAGLINTEFGYLIDREISADDLAAGSVTFGLDQRVLEESVTDDLSGVMLAISERVDSLGVTQPRIAMQGNNQIRVQVPGERDPQRLIANVIQPANLAFHMVVPNQEQYLDLDGRVRDDVVLPPGSAVWPGKLAHIDKNTRAIEYTTRDFILQRRADLTGEDVRTARVTFNPTDPVDPIVVSLELTPEGADKFAKLTTEFGGQTPPRQLAIVLDGVVRSAPNLNEPILNGRASISGGFTSEEATELSQVLRAGALPAPLEITGARVVGATMGAQSIQMGINALIWGTLLISIFMVFYYGTAGAISIVALALNVLIIVAIMAMARATLTLSGIGGILLTIGMAIDANILIYERIREEVASGRPLRQAIGLGFNRAFTVILDSNVTTLMTALVLLQFTEGSVFGFALTMTFGLIANLFTGLTVTYTLCSLWFTWKGNLSLGKFWVFHKGNFDFIKASKITFGVSAVVLLAGVIGLAAIGGPRYGVDFAGGVSAEVQFAEGADIDETAIRNALAASPLGGGTVTKLGDRENTYVIDVRLLERPAGFDTAAAMAGLIEANDAATTATELAAAPGSGDGDPYYTEYALRRMLADSFGTEYEIQSMQFFSAQMGLSFATLALTVTLLASIAILVYLWFRFELFFGVAAVLALVHDLVIVLVLATLWGVEVSLDEVAAMMVLLGYSVNDTIVIFDRIRETTRTVHGKSFRELCNLSMNQSLSRTIITSGTLLFASLMLLFLGGPGLETFAKIITLGTIVGTCSSIGIATPLVYFWNERQGDRIRQQIAAKKRKKVEVARPVRSLGR